jgi:hypothetical protein
MDQADSADSERSWARWPVRRTAILSGLETASLVVEGLETAKRPSDVRQRGGGCSGPLEMGASAATLLFLSSPERRQIGVGPYQAHEEIHVARTPDGGHQPA